MLTDDLAAMQSALSAWIQQAPQCADVHVGDIAHRLFNGMRGRYPLDQLVRIWRMDDKVQAFAIVYPHDSGYDAVISPAQRGTDLEREMLEWGYATSRQWIDASEPVLTDVPDCDEHRAALLRELGYVPEDEPYLFINERSLEGELPAVTLPDGFHIRGARGEEDAALLAAVHSGAFGSEWTTELYRDEVMRKPGYTAELERVVVAPDGSLAAICIIWLDGLNKIGLFEPVGTHEAYQRQGLGRALLSHGLQLMRVKGMQIAHVGSDVDNPASNGLYQALGFAPRYRITAYGRQ